MEQNENKNVETAEATQVSHEETRKKLKKQRVRQIVASLIGVAILAFGLWKIVCLFLDYNSNETSNDAQIEQYISPVNLRASGYIAKVYFREHQEVHKGDTLLVLDDREYRIRLMKQPLRMSRQEPMSSTLQSRPPRHQLLSIRHLSMK